ncbi:MAG: hypothetical protein Q4G52_01210 [Clostridia bacterium]|nr:hypothetical protein [Clostridia bacterium]
MKKHSRYRAFVVSEGTSETENDADTHDNRRARYALQGIGDWATNKQRAKSKTFALLANVLQNVKHLFCLRILKWEERSVLYL